jgi:hypothetical protein
MTTARAPHHRPAPRRNPAGRPTLAASHTGTGGPAIPVSGAAARARAGACPTQSEVLSRITLGMLVSAGLVSRGCSGRPRVRPRVQQLAWGLLAW